MTGAPGRWRLAWLFLALAIPLMLAIWWFGIRRGGNPTPLAAEIALMTAPIVAAAVAGMIWRRSQPAALTRAARRSHAWPMTFLLFATLLFAPILANAWMLLRAGVTAEGIWSGWFHILSTAIRTGAAPVLALGILIQLLVCLIQTEIGIFLGIRLTDHLLRR